MVDRIDRYIHENDAVQTSLYRINIILWLGVCQQNLPGRGGGLRLSEKLTETVRKQQGIFRNKLNE